MLLAAQAECLCSALPKARPGRLGNSRSAQAPGCEERKRLSFSSAASSYNRARRAKNVGVSIITRSLATIESRASATPIFWSPLLGHSERGAAEVEEVPGGSFKATPPDPRLRSRWREVERREKVEARGVEPLSSKLSAQASTCVAGDLFLRSRRLRRHTASPERPRNPSPNGAVTPPSD